VVESGPQKSDPRSTLHDRLRAATERFSHYVWYDAGNIIVDMIISFSVYSIRKIRPWGDFLP